MGAPILLVRQVALLSLHAAMLVVGWILDMLSLLSMQASSSASTGQCCSHPTQPQITTDGVDEHRNSHICMYKAWKPSAAADMRKSFSNVSKPLGYRYPVLCTCNSTMPTVSGQCGTETCTVPVSTLWAADLDHAAAYILYAACCYQLAKVC